MYLVGNSLFSIMNGTLLSWRVLCFYCLFSYSSLLDLQYGGRIWKSLAVREQARETGISVREAEWIDVELFLDKYPRWELGALHWSVILHEMFLHIAEQGCKEVERLVHWGSTSDPDLQAEYSAMELVGYWKSCKENCNIYPSVYLLKRPPGLPPCDDQWRRTICDIFSSLTGQLHWHECPATIKKAKSHMRKFSGWPARRHWKPPKCSKVI